MLQLRLLIQAHKLNILFVWNQTYLWGMPMITLSIPAALDLSMIIFRAGIRTSHPSKPKRFSEDHLRARKSSKLYHQCEQAQEKASRSYFSCHKYTLISQWGCSYYSITKEWSAKTDRVERTSLASKVLFSLSVNFMMPGVSNFCLIHWHCSILLINMNSTPIWPQYDACNIHHTDKVI